MEGKETGGLLQTVSTAIDLLDCFAEAEELGVSDVSRRLGIAKSTAHRLLTTLASRGLIEQNPNNTKYRLGLHLYELGNLAITRVELRRNARGVLEWLREASGWTVQLSIATGTDSLVLDRVQSLRSLKALPEFTRRLPLHVTAHGKAMCAHDSLLAQRRISAGLTARTDRSITDPEVFLRELEGIRRRGYATARGEAVPEIASVGAPILDARGAVVAAISINGPHSELVPGSERLGRLAIAGAQQLSRELNPRAKPIDPVRNG